MHKSIKTYLQKSLVLFWIAYSAKRIYFIKSRERVHTYTLKLNSFNRLVVCDSCSIYTYKKINYNTGETYWNICISFRHIYQTPIMVVQCSWHRRCLWTKAILCMQIKLQIAYNRMGRGKKKTPRTKVLSTGKGYENELYKFVERFFFSIQVKLPLSNTVCEVVEMKSLKQFTRNCCCFFDRSKLEIWRVFSIEMIRKYILVQ